MDLVGLIVPALLTLSLLCFVGFLVQRGKRQSNAHLSLGSAPQPSRVAATPPAPATPPPNSADALDEVATPVPADLPYTRRRYLLTQAEREFFAVLQTAVPNGWYLFPQVRLANLVLLQKGTRNWKPHFSRIAAKCVDFVLCDPAEIGPRLVIELDDASHDLPDRQARDAFVDAALRSAGLPILHVRWQRRYDGEQLAAQIRQACGLPNEQAAQPAMALALGTAARPTPPAPAVTSPRWACHRCNAAIDANAKFCRSCGATLKLG